MHNTIPILTVSFYLTIHVLFAQPESSAHQTMAQLFERNYNMGTYDSIFLAFSNEMKSFLPIEKTNSFLSGVKNQAGQITKREFVRFDNGNYASYKTSFERALLAINISIDKEGKMNGLLIKPWSEGNTPIMQRNISKLKLPFIEEWTVVWGGDTKALNYHVENPAQKYAFDMVIKNDKGMSYQSSGRTNEDYYAFGKELHAPCDGEVVMVVDGVKDNVPGEVNPVDVPGNTVIMRTANNEYLFFAHFKQHSIKVSQGQKVKQGQVLGLCGNSGNSSEPHLHFHIQHVENMHTASGIKCYFESIVVNGTLKANYSPIQADRIKNN